MDYPPINRLLENLKDPDETTRMQATEALWQIWFQQKGIHGLTLLNRSQTLLAEGDVGQAEALLNSIIRDQPDFAEAWNRRAVLYYFQGDYVRSLADCQQVIALNPIHFGAWHGMGLCAMALKDYPAALKAFRQALTIQPYALENQRLILECTAKLS